MTGAAHTKVIKPQADKQAFYTQLESRPETMDQKYQRILIFSCRRKSECPEKTYLRKDCLFLPSKRPKQLQDQFLKIQDHHNVC